LPTNPDPLGKPGFTMAEGRGNAPIAISQELSACEPFAVLGHSLHTVPAYCSWPNAKGKFRSPTPSVLCSEHNLLRDLSAPVRGRGSRQQDGCEWMTGFSPLQILLIVNSATFEQYSKAKAGLSVRQRMTP
jgi:hypothetical protein